MASSDEMKRAESGLRISQFKFQQGLKQAEPGLPSVEHTSTILFCGDVTSFLHQNTPANIQTCKEWVMKNIAPSQARIDMLGEYLVSLSKSIIVAASEKPVKSSKAAKAARNRLDVLLFVGDILHTDKFHRTKTAASAHGDFASVLKSHIEVLIKLAGSYATTKDSPIEQKLKTIINSLAASHCISASDFKAYREVAIDSVVVAQGGVPMRKRNYELPTWHGDDRNVPWYHLPASSMLEPMIKNPDRAIEPSHVRMANFKQKQASDHVRKLLDNYFDDIDLKYQPTGDNPTGGTEKYKLWLDPMGQIVKKNRETGEVRTVYNGYGWSTKFCRDMLNKGIPEKITGAREAYMNAKQAKSVEKHRRHTSSQERARSSSLDRSSARSNSRSRSRDRYQRGRHENSRDEDGDDTTFKRRSRFNDDYDQNRDRPTSSSHNRRNRFDGDYDQDRDRRTSSTQNRNTSQQRWSEAKPDISHPISQGYPPNNFPPPPPPPIGGQYSSYQVPPPPFHLGAGQVPPPPPPPPTDFSGAYPSPQNMNGYQNQGYQGHGYQNRGYQNQGYQHQGYQNQGYQNQGYSNNFGNRDVGYGNSGAYNGPPQSQSSFRGGYQGNNRGNHRGRGAYRGRGGRWD